MKINWVLEREVFSDNHDRLAEAATAAGHNVISWDDSWWKTRKWPSLENEYALFHGSLGNANRIAFHLRWRPGAFCNTSAFACRAWYENTKKWLLHRQWVFSTVAEFVAEPERYLADIGSPRSFFVRPDSPLKPFSGRVIQREELSFDALDYGFYYDDKNLPIVIIPVTEVGMEWRFVISGHEVTTWSAYEASERTETSSDCPSEVTHFVKDIADSFVPPDPLYIVDVCINEGNVRLVEINPFSGADLYACDRKAIVSAVERILMGSQGQQRLSADA